MLGADPYLASVERIPTQHPWNGSLPKIRGTDPHPSRFILHGVIGAGKSKLFHWQRNFFEEVW